MKEVLDIASVCGTVIALIAFLFGVYQYAKAQKWKKAEFAAKELEKLTADEYLHLACVLLDWEGRTIKVPESYSESFREKSFTHSWKILENAMVGSIHGPNGRDGFTTQEVFYRDIFDKFFTYLENINHFINIDLIEKKDVSILKYWLEQMAYSDLSGRRPIFHGFLKCFGYEGTLSLMEKFGINNKKNLTI